MNKIFHNLYGVQNAQVNFAPLSLSWPISVSILGNPGRILINFGVANVEQQNDDHSRNLQTLQPMRQALYGSSLQHL
jgi:hypothetical protein